MAELRIRNVIVVGAGGNVGRSIVHALDSDPGFSVSILAREASTSVFPSHIPVRRVSDTFPESEVVEAFKGQDAVVSAISLSNVLQQMSLIDAAVKARVQHFIPAEYGGNKDGAGDRGEIIPRHKDKEYVIKRLREKESEGLTWTAIATGPFFDWGLCNGFLGYDLKSHRARIYDSGDVPWTATTLSTIGRTVAGVFHHTQETANRFVYVYSIRTTQNELLSVLEKLTGARWERESVSMDKAIENGRKALEGGDMTGVIPLIHSYFFRKGMGADYTKDVEADNDLLGLPSSSLEEIVQEALT